MEPAGYTHIEQNLMGALDTNYLLYTKDGKTTACVRRWCREEFVVKLKKNIFSFCVYDVIAVSLAVSM